jgi:hypothetical protein
MHIAVKPGFVDDLIDEEGVDESLVTDHGIEGLILYHDFDGINQTFSGTMRIGCRDIAFEAEFSTRVGWSDKALVRSLLIESAVYVTNGESAEKYIGMNASFKRLLNFVMESLDEQQRFSH